jgi:hypothetical protein
MASKVYIIITEFELIAKNPIPITTIAKSPLPLHPSTPTNYTEE